MYIHTQRILINKRLLNIVGRIFKEFGDRLYHES